MDTSEQYDLLVIGSGEAGKYLAWTFSKEGQRTAVIEKRLVGGSCPNVACLPSKNIIHSAKVASLANNSEMFGVSTGATSVDMARVQQLKQAMVNQLIEVHQNRYDDSGVELIMGRATFVDRRTVEVALNEGGSRRLFGQRVIVNVGTRAAIPPIPGLEEAQPMTHVEALDLDRLPQHLLVIGGGYVGLELAQAARRLGSRVTVIEQGSQLASREDEDVAAAILKLFQDEGIDVLLGTTVSRVEGRSGEVVRLEVETKDGPSSVEGTDLLIATGRTPNTDDMGLELAGIEVDERGYIVTNERLETTAPDVWAVGDCAGSPQFTHVAFDDFRIVRDALRGGGGRTTDHRLVPFCMFTDPPLARIGLNESEAKSQGVDYRIATLPMAAVLRTRTLSAPRGFVKMLVEADGDGILGFSAFGAEASEMLAAVQVAMMGRMSFTALRDAIFTHPTAAEGLTVLLADLPSIEEAGSLRYA